MSVRIRRQINNNDGTPLVGAQVEVFEVGQVPVVATASSNSEGIIEFDLPDTRSSRGNVLYDLKVSFSGSIWWIRGQDQGQVHSIDVRYFFRYPRYTTTLRDALTLGATDAGTGIWNTTTEKLNIWDGAAWVIAPGETEGGFDLYADVSDELTNPTTGDRLLITDLSAIGEPNKWLSLSRLRTWLASTLSLSASRITSGVLAIARLPLVTVAKGGTSATTAADARVNLGLGTAATLDFTENDDAPISSDGTDGDYWVEY